MEVLLFIWHNTLELIQSGVLLGTRGHLPWLFKIEQICAKLYSIRCTDAGVHIGPMTTQRATCEPLSGRACQGSDPRPHLTNGFREYVPDELTYVSTYCIAPRLALQIQPDVLR